MDYDDFIRLYTQEMLKKLQHYPVYNGTTMELMHRMDVDFNNFHQVEKIYSLFYPLRIPNIDAPIKDYINFLSYYGDYMPELGLIFLNEERLKYYYEKIILTAPEPNHEQEIISKVILEMLFGILEKAEILIKL